MFILAADRLKYTRVCTASARFVLVDICIHYVIMHLDVSRKKTIQIPAARADRGIKGVSTWNAMIDFPPFL